MVNKNYIKGRNFEYRVRNFLKKIGFFVIRQARSAFPDLIAIRVSPLTGKVCIFECKCNKDDFSKEELNKLMEMWTLYEFHPFLAFKVKRKLFFIDLLTQETMERI